MVDLEKYLKAWHVNRPDFLNMMGCEFNELYDNGDLAMNYDIGVELCHSIDIVQGGFVTAMLDATMSHAVFINNEDIERLSTLEIKVSFYEPARAGKLRCVGRVDKLGGSIAFLSGEIYDTEGKLLCTSTSTAKIFRKK